VKLKLTQEWDELPVNKKLEVDCPTCNLHGFSFSFVTASELPRNYQDSPNTRQLLAHVEARARGELAPSADPSFDVLKVLVLFRFVVVFFDISFLVLIFLRSFLFFFLFSFFFFPS
jgi:hypothetical protein